MATASSTVSSLPLVLSLNTIYIYFRSPSFCNKRVIVIVIEFSLVFCFTPKTVKTWVCSCCWSKSVGSVYRSDQGPSIALTLVYMFYKNTLQSFTSMYRVRHPACVPWTFCQSFPTPLEWVSEFLQKRTRCKRISTIMISCGYSNYSFSLNNYIVNKWYFRAVIAILS